MSPAALPTGTSACLAALAVAAPAAVVVVQGTGAQAAAAASAALRRAADLRKDLVGLEGPDREAAREKVLEAYRRVWRDFPEQRILAAEAAFRAGELLRAWERPAAARAEFSRAIALGEGTPFDLRARFELAHIQRRGGELEAAQAAFAALAASRDASSAVRDAARLWQGRLLFALGRRGEAVRVLELVAEHGSSPLDRVEAYDELALQLLRNHDLEGAAGRLEQCREALAERAEERGELGERLRDALQSMRSVVALQRAIRERVSRVRVDR